MSLSQVNSLEKRPLKDPGSRPFSLLAYIFRRISLMASITAFLFIVMPFSVRRTSGFDSAAAGEVAMEGERGDDGDSGSTRESRDDRGVSALNVAGLLGLLLRVELDNSSASGWSKRRDGGESQLSRLLSPRKLELVLRCRAPWGGEEEGEGEEREEEGVEGSESILSSDNLLAWTHLRFDGGGSTSISSTFALWRFTTTTDSPTLMATESGDLPLRKSSIWRWNGGGEDTPINTTITA